MTDEQKTQETPDPNSGPSEKKAYEKPQVRHEQVFETMAMSCGKVQSTQGSCRFNRKSS